MRPSGAPGYGVKTTVGSSSSEYAAYIESPTSYGILLIRWLVDASSYDIVHAYQKATVAQPINRTGGLGQAPLSSMEWNRGNSTPAEHVLNLLAQFTPANLPELNSETSAVNANLLLPV
jgi:hypothetical protein